ncbi:hypothetical protein pdam_00018176 [Pocillopora damicornis]|uniref:Uncharacterized protein n=1 Tax=Pocillopora damicornis TaxID=46731 RepID=A0A3M6TUE3_POCDA|nr:hypothetical protein pdam_00018176 [Pocillopora damicornis]
MDMNEKDVANDVWNILEAESAGDSEHSEQLAVLIASGRKWLVYLSPRIKSRSLLNKMSRNLLHFLPVDQGNLLNDLNDNFMVKRELGVIGGRPNLNCGRYMAIASAALLCQKS